MKITVLDAQTLGKDVDLSVFEKYGEVTIYQTTQKQDSIKNIGDSDIVITNKVIIDSDVIDNCENIKLICIAATGMNNVDLEYAKQKRISVTNVAGYSTKSVAQHTFAMLFYLLEKLSYYDRFVKDGKWHESQIFTNVSRPFYEISGKKFGIIGLGAIGKEVAKIADAFGAQVQYYSTSGNNADQNYPRVSLNQLMSDCDIISIHAPLNSDTHNLIGYEQLQMMQKDAILLNLGRGNIVDEEALAKVLDEKDIYAGLDVTGVEPLPESSSLYNVNNSERLLITPHIAWTSIEARKLLVAKIEENIKNFIRNHTL